MVYPIVKFPDPILQRPAQPVTVFDDELRRLVDDMFESMYVAHGIGLAAPQIGIPKRLTVIDLSFQKTPEDKIALINPEVVTKEGNPVPAGHGGLLVVRRPWPSMARTIHGLANFGDAAGHTGGSFVVHNHDCFQRVLCVGG